MAGALLARRLTATGADAVVRSAGSLDDGQPAPPEVVSAMTAYGLDVSGHRSRLVTSADLSAADLVLAMAREHVRHAVVTDPSAWSRTFTLKELVRRGGQTGPRRRGEPVTEWLARVHAGRQRSALLGDSRDDDVADPIGGPPHGYWATAGLLDRLTGDLAALCWGVPAGG
jgi:protein-tyrosine phosphatase